MSKTELPIEEERFIIKLPTEEQMFKIRHGLEAYHLRSRQSGFLSEIDKEEYKEVLSKPISSYKFTPKLARIFREANIGTLLDLICMEPFNILKLSNLRRKDYMIIWNLFVYLYSITCLEDNTDYDKLDYDKLNNFLYSLWHRRISELETFTHDVNGDTDIEDI